MVKRRERVLLWLMKIDEDERTVTLSSDFAMAKLDKRIAVQRGRGRWSIPYHIAVDRMLIEQAT